ncbi:hypothetical protein B1L11_05680 [Microbispora sp. GKU 823]|nr:hypothetical protein B1L11_05680 [Microbispora sp. GKU 823]
MIGRGETVRELEETPGSFALVHEDHGQILHDGVFPGTRHGSLLGITASVQPPEEIVHRDLFVESGPEVAGAVLQQLTTPPPQATPYPFPDLTDRERDILRLLAAGYTNTSIAERVHLSHKTVRNYVSVIFRKLQVTGRVDAVIKARQAGLG